MLHMLHDDYGHQGLDQTLALVMERFYCGTMTQDITYYVTNFLKVDPSRGSKENILVPTDAFTKFSQRFVNNILTNILVNKWFYV